VLLRRVTAFGQELAGTLRRASVIDLLVRHIREALAPKEIAISLLPREPEGKEFSQTWPGGRPDRRPILELVERHGPLALPDGLDSLIEQGLLSPQPDSLGGWLVVPFTAKGRVTGAVALCGERSRYGQDALPLLEGLVALASVALESARLVDLQDEGRRSWQDVVDAISPALASRSATISTRYR